MQAVEGITEWFGLEERSALGRDIFNSVGWVWRAAAAGWDLPWLWADTKEHPAFPGEPWHIKHPTTPANPRILSRSCWRGQFDNSYPACNNKENVAFSLSKVWKFWRLSLHHAQPPAIFQPSSLTSSDCKAMAQLISPPPKAKPSLVTRRPCASAWRHPASNMAWSGAAPISEGTSCEQEAHEEGEPFHFEKREIVTVREFNRGGFISGLRSLQFPPETVLALWISCFFFF